ncbi:transglutaminase family protein [Crocosphaera sp. UHCC 0190]|uniref:transglutaminase family protein n=1 Tax=Crocosphaera sp. UHCC 0190 TaxID=3110246 RepID=UPI002B213A96|nr:transglutaminase family protein [Crocosphaera sp. UHCC 0190]MEA5510006.1 transglutaminase family protein [Crocosphaera sp. UHCC 0190]
MRYSIHHQTIYTYNQPVFLNPHSLRMRPRSDGWQNLLNFSLSITPIPKETAEIVDLNGNNLIQLWFTYPTEILTINIRSEVETYTNNPFSYLLESWAVNLPIDYPISLFNQLQPYLDFYNKIPDPVIVQLAQEILHKVQGNTLNFLSTLNQKIHENCHYVIRETGEPWQPGITWKNQQGSCRDTALLFMEACRVVGLGARFVSGYQEGDRHQEQRDLHAWVEVYLPGGGWRGYDPTHGLAVANGYIALAASPVPQGAAPVTGEITPVRPIVETNQPPESAIAVHLCIEHHN